MRESSTGPTCVANIRLNWRASVSVPRLPQFGQAISDGGPLRSSLAEAMLAVAAVDHRVGEAGDVAGGLPDPRVHDDRRVDADDVVAQRGPCAATRRP